MTKTKMDTKGLEKECHKAGEIQYLRERLHDNDNQTTIAIFSIEELQKDINEIKVTLNKFIEKCDDAFVRANEFKAVIYRVVRLEKSLLWIIGIILGAVILSILRSNNIII